MRRMFVSRRSLGGEPVQRRQPWRSIEMTSDFVQFASEKFAATAIVAQWALAASSTYLSTLPLSAIDKDDFFGQPSQNSVERDAGHCEGNGTVKNRYQRLSRMSRSGLTLTLARAWARKDLRDLMAMRDFHHGLGNFAVAKNLRSLSVGSSRSRP
jgi:hypothetical protein